MEYLILILGILIVTVVVVYELREAGHSIGDTLNGVMDSVFGPRTVVTPKAVQAFLNEPANQPGGYEPWIPTGDDDSDDETYPPKWLKKAVK